MKTAYCLSGLGADERIFGKLDVPGLKLKHVKWLKPEPNERLDQYAKRIASQITEPNPILIGVSFGGMMAIEIAKFRPVEKLALISSIKSTKEIPTWIKTCGKLKLDRILPSRALKEIRPLRLLRPIQNYFLGASSAEEKKLANEFRDNVDPEYLKWSVAQVFNWKNDWTPECLFHVHGSNDHIFPVKHIKAAYVIKGAGHFMVMDHHQEVSQALQTVLHISPSD